MNPRPDARSACSSRPVHQPAVFHERRFHVQEAGIDDVRYTGGASGLDCVEVLLQTYRVGVVGRDKQGAVDATQCLDHQCRLAKVSLSYVHARCGQFPAKGRVHVARAHDQ